MKDFRGLVGQQTVPTVSREGLIFCFAGIEFGRVVDFGKFLILLDYFSHAISIVGVLLLPLQIVFAPNKVGFVDGGALLHLILDDTLL
jgi:hypothetical protein